MRDHDQIEAQDHRRDGDGDLDAAGEAVNREALTQALQAQCERSVAIATEICGLAGFTFGQIRGEIVDEDVIIHVDGLELDLATLDERAFESMQFLINKATQRYGTRRSRVHVRVDGLRSRRRDAPDQVIQWLQQRANEVGRLLTLGPLDGAEARAWTAALHRAGPAGYQLVGAGDQRKVAFRPDGVDADGVARRQRRRRRRRKGD